MVYWNENELRCGHYLSTGPYPGGSPSLLCETSFPECGSGQITSADVARGLSDPDVLTAYAAAPITYGLTDASSTHDGNIDQITIGSRTISLGVPCDSRPGCIPHPPGVLALLTLLRGIEWQESERGACSRALPSSVCGLGSEIVEDGGTCPGIVVHVASLIPKRCFTDLAAACTCACPILNAPCVFDIVGATCER